MKIGIVGCGHMGSAIAQALAANKTGGVWVSSPAKPHICTRSNVKKLIHWTVDNREVVKKTDVIIIAVKPGVVGIALLEMKGVIRKNQIIISIAAGIPLKKLFAWTGGHAKIVRVMPNLPSQVLEGASVWKALPGLTLKEKQIVKKLLSSFGKVFEVHSENLIDIATAASGGAPAYTAAFLETIASVLSKNGMNKKDARALALQAVFGSTLYINKTGIDFSELQENVQTKGGTTEACFKVLKKKKWQEIFEIGLMQAYKRAKEISQV